MHSTKTLKIGLAFAGLCALGAAARPAGAQTTVPTYFYTLSNVTFSDGGIAVGSFSYQNSPNPGNPAAPIYTTNVNVTTTNGVTDAFGGSQYVSGLYDPHTTNDFIFQTTAGRLYLDINGPAAPGTYALVPGNSSQQFTASLETNNNTVRYITGGSVIVSAAVPEASTTVSFGLLLALGLGGVAVAARKKKATV